MYSRYYNSWNSPSWYRYPYYGNYYNYRYRNRHRDYGYGDYYNSDYYSSPYWYEYLYGEPRDNPYSWERDDESNREIRNRRNRRRSDDRSDPPTPTPAPEPEPEPEPAPEPPKEEIAKTLLVKGVDYMITENAKKHRTDKYECTSEDRERDGKKLKPECVVRRGDTMEMKVTFKGDYEKKKHDLTLQFTIGKNPKETKGTKAVFPVNEEERKTFSSEDWGANLLSVDGKTVHLEVFIPSNCIIGEWNFAVSTKSFGKDKDGNDTVLRATYKNKADITILFNPWCKEDLVYCEEDLDEYVLNDFGYIWAGSSHSNRPKPWMFGQFKDMILDCSLKLLRDGFNEKIQPSMSNPVKVSRVLAAMVNANDEDDGILVGNWSGDYNGGTSPLTWIGSINILREYYKAKKDRSVKFGQCWVYSGVLTTVCRALGIPCRSVTNFDSAHDTDTSSTIDIYLTEDGSERDDWLTRDSVWNFHVWNEVYIKRPDLPAGYDGWQALDATPQERSDGIFTCGPAPISAVKKGRIDIQYDTAFVFSEVNADKITWERANGEWVVSKIEERAIGNEITTKKPGHIEVDDDYASNARTRTILKYAGRRYKYDVTNQYKYAEGSEEERKAVDMAYRLAMAPKRNAYSGTSIKPVTVDIHVEDDDLMIGEDLKIEIDIKNSGQFSRKIKSVVVHLYPEMYTGEVGKPFFKHKFPENTVNANSSLPLPLKVTFSDYYKHLWEDNYVKIVANVKIESIENEAGQREMAEYIFQFEKPELSIQAPKTVKRKDKAEFTVNIHNPTPVTLTNCLLSVQSSGFDDINDLVVPDIKAKGTSENTIKVRATRAGIHNLVFVLDSKELFAMKGTVEVKVM